MAQMTLDTEWLGHLDGNYDAATYKLSGLGKKKTNPIFFACTIPSKVGKSTHRRFLFSLGLLLINYGILDHLFTFLSL